MRLAHKVPCGRMCPGANRGALFACLAAVFAFAIALFCSGSALATESDGGLADGQRTVEGSAIDEQIGIGINGFERLNKGTTRKYDGTSYGYRFPVDDTEAIVVLAIEDELVVFVPAVAAESAGFSADDAAAVDALMQMVFSLDKEASKGGNLLSAQTGERHVVVGEDSFDLGYATVTRDVAIGDGHTYLTVQRTDGQKDSAGVVCCDYGHLVVSSAVETEAVPTWFEELVSFLTTIDYRPLWVSLKTSATALVVVFILGLLAAWKSMGVKSRWKGLVDTLFTIPMVLPPTVCGFLLLLLFGNATPFGQWLQSVGIKLVFTWPATVIAATVVAFPLMYRTARGAFEALDGNMLDAARTLGWSERRIFYRLMVPLTWPSIAAGTVLAFARAMGEFGATLFCAGNYAGITQTMPIAIYFQWMGGNTDVAIFWVIVVIIISFIVILFINVYSAHSQRYRLGGLTRKERKANGLANASSDASRDDQTFKEISAEDAAFLLSRDEE